MCVIRVTYNTEVLCSHTIEDPALRFNKKYLNLCSEDERKSYRVGTTWGWVINDRKFVTQKTLIGLIELAHESEDKLCRAVARFEDPWRKL